jgi:hypothetical protein
MEGGGPPGMDLDRGAVVVGCGGMHRDPGMAVLHGDNLDQAPQLS